MEDQYSKELKDKINGYKEQGYTDSFEYDAEQRQLVSMNSDDDYQPEDVILIEQHRFVDTEKTSNSMTIYAIETWDGGRGLVMAKDGKNNGGGVQNFMVNVSRKNSSDKGI